MTPAKKQQNECFIGYTMIYCKGGEALAQIALRSYGHPIPGSAQDQVGWGFQQRGLAEDVPAHGRGTGTI